MLSGLSGSLSELVDVGVELVANELVHVVGALSNVHLAVGDEVGVDDVHAFLGVVEVDEHIFNVSIVIGKELADVVENVSGLSDVGVGLENHDPVAVNDVHDVVFSIGAHGDGGDAAVEGNALAGAIGIDVAAVEASKASKTSVEVGTTVATADGIAVNGDLHVVLRDGLHELEGGEELSVSEVCLPLAVLVEDDRTGSVGPSFVAVGVESNSVDVVVAVTIGILGDLGADVEVHLVGPLVVVDSSVELFSGNASFVYESAVECVEVAKGGCEVVAGEVKSVDVAVEGSHLDGDLVCEVCVVEIKAVFLCEDVKLPSEACESAGDPSGLSAGDAVVNVSASGGLSGDPFNAACIPVVCDGDGAAEFVSDGEDAVLELLALLGSGLVAFPVLAAVLEGEDEFHAGNIDASGLSLYGLGLCGLGSSLSGGGFSSSLSGGGFGGGFGSCFGGYFGLSVATSCEEGNNHNESHEKRKKSGLLHFGEILL